MYSLIYDNSYETKNRGIITLAMYDYCGFGVKNALIPSTFLFPLFPREGPVLLRSWLAALVSLLVPPPSCSDFAKCQSSCSCFMLPSNPTCTSPKSSSSGTVAVSPHLGHVQESISVFVWEDIRDDWAGSIGVISKPEMDAEDGVHMLECEEEEVILEGFLVRKAPKPFLDFEGGWFVSRAFFEGRTSTGVGIDEEESEDGDRIRFELLFNFDITRGIVEDDGSIVLPAAAVGVVLLKKPSIPCCPSSSFSRPVKEREIYSINQLIAFVWEFEATYNVELHFAFQHGLSRLIPQLLGILHNVICREVSREGKWSLSRPGRFDTYWRVKLAW